MKSNNMFKTIALTILVAASAATAYGQGQVNFITRTIGARVIDTDGSFAGTNSTGVAWLAQLFAANGTGASTNSLAPVGNPVNLRTGVNSGYVLETGTTTLGQPVNTTVNVTAVNGGAVTLQMRVWQSVFGANFDTAANTVGAKIGYSNPLSFAVTGNPNGAPPTTAIDLTGLTSFQVFTVVPEPSTYALATLAVGAVFFMRRRKA